jgi:hypothetical protein
LKALYKATIIIWATYDPTALDFKLTELASQAENADAFCSSMKGALIADPEKDPDWDATDFFDSWDDDEDEVNVTLAA